MAIFNVEFARGSLPGPSYDDYSVGISSMCNDDGQPRTVKFNDTTGDFVVGYNWTSVSGSTPQDIRINSFTDVTTQTDTSNGETTTVNVPANTLKDNSTGLDLTYPYTTPISNLPNIVQHINASELYCADTSKFTTERVRRLEYVIFDTNGIGGSVKIATLTNTPQ